MRARERYCRSAAERFGVNNRASRCNGGERSSGGESTFDASIYQVSRKRPDSAFCSWTCRPCVTRMLGVEVWRGRVIQRTLRASALGAAALDAAIVGSVASEHAGEPVFSGTSTYRNDNFRTGQNLAERVLTPSK